MKMFLLDVAEGVYNKKGKLLKRRKVMYTHFKVPFLDIKHYDFDSEIVRIIPKEMSREHKVIAIDKLGNVLTVGMVHSEDKNLIEFLEQETKMMVIPFQISLESWLEIFPTAYLDKEKSFNYVG